MEFQELPNVGPRLAENLRQAGFDSIESFRAAGAEEAFLRIRTRVDPAACFHQLTALEGAIQGVRKTLLSQERKTELRTFFDGLSGAAPR